MVVARFKIKTIFGDEAKRYFRPSSIRPLSSDDEGDEGETICLERFNIVEEAVAPLTFKIVDTWIRAKIPIATSGTLIKA